MPTGTITPPAEAARFAGRGHTAEQAELLDRYMPPEPATLHPHDCPCSCGALRGECEVTR